MIFLGTFIGVGRFIMALVMMFPIPPMNGTGGDLTTTTTSAQEMY
jgi:hypothetical protein